MKKFYVTSTMLLFAAATVFAQNNVHLVPASGNVCNPMPISVGISGNSFSPVSYLWSTGETSPVIEIAGSGTYTVTVTGYAGNSSILSTRVRSAFYNVLSVPRITALTPLWVCKEDTIRLSASPGYDNIIWSTGATGSLFEKKMDNPGTPGTPSLDTLSLYYTASIDGVCSATSETVVLRSIRRPDGVGRFYQGRMNISSSDSIPAGLVLEYLYPVTYEMDFTEIGNPLNIIKYVTAPGSRRAPASMLTPGSSYSVVTTPVINGDTFCPGEAHTIGISASGNIRLALNTPENDVVKTYRIYDVQGRMIMEKQASDFNQEWLSGLNPQMLIIERSGETTEVFRMQIVR